MRGVLAQEIHHRVKNNLQTVASLLRLQARATDGVDPREALEHSVNRILAIAAVHEVLTERRDDDVLLDDLLDRLRAMLVQGIGGGKHVEARSSPSPSQASRATALALVFSELLQNALEHGGEDVRIELTRRNGDVVLAIADSGAGAGDGEDGTGLSIVRALVRDELNGRFELRATRARGRKSSSPRNRSRRRLVGSWWRPRSCRWKPQARCSSWPLWAASVVWTFRDAGRRCSDPSLRLASAGAAILLPFLVPASTCCCVLARIGSTSELGGCGRRCSKRRSSKSAERCPACAVPLEPEFRCCAVCGEQCPH